MRYDILREKRINLGLDLRGGMHLVMAESCTGGLVGHRITNIPGSSDYYLGSVTAYAYEAKEALIGVKHETLLQYGAVSRPTVLEMAAGVRRRPSRSGTLGSQPRQRRALEMSGSRTLGSSAGNGR